MKLKFPLRLEDRERIFEQVVQKNRSKKLKMLNLVVAHNEKKLTKKVNSGIGSKAAGKSGRLRH